MEGSTFLGKLISAPLTDFQSLKSFSSGVESMDRFIRGDFRMSVENHYCQAYAVTFEDEIVAFYSKPRYPAMDIAYFAIQKNWQGKHIGDFLIKQIADLARRQTLAGCQFLTVEALATKEYSAVGFYERCGFAPNEVKKPYKDTLRMYMTLYARDEAIDE